MDNLGHVLTDALKLDAPRTADLGELHRLYTDPRVWTHFPSLRHTDVGETETMLGAWLQCWERDGLGPWVVRPRDGGALLGHGGCSLRHEVFWNLGYRFCPEAQGHGYATDVSLLAIGAAHRVCPEVPVVAYLLEHNHASRRVAEKVGLTLCDRRPDAGNPDPTAMRLVFADRELTEQQRQATLR